MIWWAPCRRFFSREKVKRFEDINVVGHLVK